MSIRTLCIRGDDSNYNVSIVSTVRKKLDDPLGATVEGPKEEKEERTSNVDYI